MMRAYSMDFRERVVKAVASGLSRRDAARRLDVGAATAVRWAQQWKTTGSLAAAVGKPGRSPLEAHADFLLDLWTKQPDITLEELRNELAVGRGVTTGLGSIHRFFARRDITFKKTLSAAEQARADVAVAREAWKSLQATLDPEKLVFIDETGTATNTTRTRGRAPRGKRLVGLPRTDIER